MLQWHTYGLGSGDVWCLGLRFTACFKMVGVRCVQCACVCGGGC